MSLRGWRQGGSERGNPLRHHRVPDPGAALRTVDQPRLVEHLEVVADRRLALAERLDEIAGADPAGFLGGDQAEQSKPGRVGKGGEAAGELVGLCRVERGGKNRRTALHRVDDGD